MFRVSLLCLLVAHDPEMKDHLCRVTRKLKEQERFNSHNNDKHCGLEGLKMEK